MTCYIPCHGSNLFKIKSICSFHTLCPTSLLQSTVDYSITLKTGCSDNKLITYFVVNCVKIFWNITNTFPLSLSLSRSFSLLMVNLVRHIDREKFLNFYHKTYCLQALKWRDWGKRFSVTPPGPPPPPTSTCKPLICLPCAIHYKRLPGSIDSVYDRQILISNEACSFSGKNYLLCNKPESPEASHLRCINSLKVS